MTLQVPVGSVAAEDDVPVAQPAARHAAAAADRAQPASAPTHRPSMPRGRRETPAPETCF